MITHLHAERNPGRLPEPARRVQGREQELRAVFGLRLGDGDEVLELFLNLLCLAKGI